MRSPPSFHEAKNRRQRARSAGMHPDYWYAVEYADRVKVGQIVEVKFWGKSFALFRGEDGELRCIENRCAHRQLPLTSGEVRGCHVVCPYHGWAYDGEGCVVDIPHEMFGKELPNIRVPHCPVKVRYGLVFMFPGDPEKAESVPLPHIPELEGPKAWACVPFDYVWSAHHSMIMDNICDFTHEYLHRKTQPFAGAKMTNLEADGDKIYVEYDTRVGAGKLVDKMLDRAATNTEHMKLCYEYPYQWSNTGDWIKHWCMLLPMDRRTTRAFFLFYYKSLRLPYLPLKIPRRVMEPMLKIANRFVMDPIMAEDGFAMEAEQEGYDRHFDAPIAEVSPVVNEFQKLTIRKWEEHLAQQDRLPTARRLPVTAG